MNKIFFALLLTFFVSAAFTQQTSVQNINRDKVLSDSVFISYIVQLLQENPGGLADSFTQSEQKIPLEDIGFGYSLLAVDDGNYFVSTHNCFLFFKKQLVSYRISFIIEVGDSLFPLYKKFLSGLLHFDSNNKPQPFDWNARAAWSPLPDSLFLVKTASQVPDDVKELMSPFIGTEYGTIGYEDGRVIDNRKVFLALEPRMNTDLLLAILHAKNPATRLMAMEYIAGHPNIFPDSKKSIMDDINVIVRGCPVIKTISGCIVSEKSAEPIVKEIFDNK